MFLVWVCLIILFAYIISLNTRISKLEEKLGLKKKIEIDFDYEVVPQEIEVKSEKVPSKNTSHRKKDVFDYIENFLKYKPSEKNVSSEKNNSVKKYPTANYFMKGNPIAKIGVLILFVGIAFLLKYVSNFIYFSIEIRLIAVAIAGIAAILIGCKLHKNNPIFAAILEGGGVGLLFITTFSAFKVFALLSPLVAFCLLVSIVIVSSLLSIYQNAKSLAILGVLGGFLAPLLISTDNGDMRVLFSYYAILNIFIFAMAWFRSWPDLNILGFVFTYAISVLWGWQTYQPEYFYTSEFFLIVFFLLYFGISTLFAVKNIKDHFSFNLLIIIGTPFVTYALQANIVHHLEYGLAISSFILSAFYAIAGLVFYYQRKLLGQLFGWFALLFGTIAVNLVLTDNWTALTWALESLMLMYIGIKQNKFSLRYAAAALQYGSGLIFLHGWVDPAISHLFIHYVQHYYLTGAAIGLAALVCSGLWYKHGDMNERFLAISLMIWGSLWWYGTTINNVMLYPLLNYKPALIMLFFAASSFAFWALNEFLKWRLLRIPAFYLLPVMILTAIYYIHTNEVYSYLITMIWAISFIVLFGMLNRSEKQSLPSPVPHIVSLLLLTSVIASEATRCMDLYLGLNWSNTWQFIVWGLVPAGMLYLIAKKYINKDYHRNTTAMILAIWLGFWFLISNSYSGNVSPLYHIPVFNPLDISILLCLYAAYSWYLADVQHNALYADFVTANNPISILIIILFIWMNAVLLRTIHYSFNIPYDLNSLWASPVVQTSLSIFWTMIAVVATFISSRIKSRLLWFVGFSLIGVVVAKLFLIDLSNVGTLERIITFITVGVLLLLNGYISPMPPKRKE